MGKHRDDTHRAQQAEHTRLRLIEVACERFVADGFAATSMGAIAEAAGVTKGALYHHFADKRALYQVCYHAAHTQLADRIEAIAHDSPGGDRYEVFIGGCVAFLRSVLSDRWVVVVTVAEGPAALGHTEWMALDGEYAWATIGERLQRMQERGDVRGDVDVRSATVMLNAAINEAAVRIARSDTPERELESAESALRALLAGLRAGVR